MRRKNEGTEILWSEIVRRIEAGHRRRTIAADMGFTLSQLNYRIRKLKEQAHLENEVAATQNLVSKNMEVERRFDLRDEFASSHGKTVIVAESSDSAASLYDESWTRTWNSNRLKLLVKEPTTIFAYWEIDETRKRLLSQHFQCGWEQLPFQLRLYDVTDIQFDGYNANSTQQMQVFANSDKWYIHDVEPRRRYLADIGTLTIHSGFFTILRSNIVLTPPRSSYQASVSNPQFGQLDNNLFQETRNPRVAVVKACSNQIGKSHRVAVPYEHTFDGYGDSGRRGHSWKEDM